MDEQKVDELAKIIWDYHLMHHKSEKADLIWVLGSITTKVADWAAEIYMKNYAPRVLITGGLGRHTLDTFQKSEAEVFAEIMVKKGVPVEKIWLETKSSNTGENIRFGYHLLKSKNYPVKKIILATKPYMERRGYATFMKQWPGEEINLIMSSPALRFEDFYHDEASKKFLIESLVGDLQRIKIYPEKGWQLEQEIPSEVNEAFEELVKLGYTNQLFK